MLKFHSDWAREARDACGGDDTKAAKWLVKKALEGDQELCDVLLRLGASQLLHEEVHKGRHKAPASAKLLPTVTKIKRGTTTILTRSAPSPEQVANARVILYMETYTLYGSSLSIADATKADFVASIQKYERHKEGMQNAIDFQTALMDRLVFGKTLREVMNDEQVQALARHHGVLRGAQDAA